MCFCRCVCVCMCACRCVRACVFLHVHVYVCVNIQGRGQQLNMIGEGGVKYFRSPWLVVRGSQQRTEGDKVLLCRCGFQERNQNTSVLKRTWFQDAPFRFLRTPISIRQVLVL